MMELSPVPECSVECKDRDQYNVWLYFCFYLSDPSPCVTRRQDLINNTAQLVQLVRTLSLICDRARKCWLNNGTNDRPPATNHHWTTGQFSFDTIWLSCKTWLHYYNEMLKLKIAGAFILRQWSRVDIIEMLIAIRISSSR